MRYLLRGPTRWLAPAVTTALARAGAAAGHRDTGRRHRHRGSVAAGRSCLLGRLGGLHQPGPRHHGRAARGDEGQAAARRARGVRAPPAGPARRRAGTGKLAGGGRLRGRRPVRSGGNRDRRCGTGRGPRHLRAGRARGLAGHRSFCGGLAHRRHGGRRCGGADPCPGCRERIGAAGRPARPLCRRHMAAVRRPADRDVHRSRSGAGPADRLRGGGLGPDARRNRRDGAAEGHRARAGRPRAGHDAGRRRRRCPGGRRGGLSR